MTISDRSTYLQEMAKGNGHYRIGRLVSRGSNTTAGVAASGYFSAGICFNIIGTTLPGTLTGIPLPPSPPSVLGCASFLNGYGAAARGAWLCRAYRFGTLVLSATGNQFTHDGTFTRLRRTVLGVANTDIELLPMLYLTTATTTTAAVFRMRTVAGGAGYDDQAGNATVATKTMTMPASATAVNTCLFLRLEDGDNAVLNVSNIEVTTSANAGNASIFGIEPLMPVSIIANPAYGYCDGLYGGISLPDLSPATPNAGSVTSYLCTVDISNSVASPSGIGYSIFGALAG